MAAAPLPRARKLYRGRGCDQCKQTGFYGRTGICEALVMDDTIRPLALDRAPSGEIRDRACERGMRTLRRDGWAKVEGGLTTATLLQGGAPLLDAVGIVREVLCNSVLARGADQARKGMREGASFADRLRETGAFPPLLAPMVGVGEETGDLQGALNAVANTYDVEVDATLKSIVSLLEPLIIVTMGGIIAFIILAMLLPVFQINLLAG